VSTKSAESLKEMFTTMQKLGAMLAAFEKVIPVEEEEK
jgi:hypothetical protein